MVLTAAIAGFGTLFLLAILGFPLAASMALGGVIGMVAVSYTHLTLPTNREV